MDCREPIFIPFPFVPHGRGMVAASSHFNFLCGLRQQTVFFRTCIAVLDSAVNITCNFPLFVLGLRGLVISQNIPPEKFEPGCLDKLVITDGGLRRLVLPGLAGKTWCFLVQLVA